MLKRRTVGLGLLLLGAMVLQRPEAYGQDNAERPKSEERLIIVRGADGEPEYGADFREAAARWQELGESRAWQVSTIDSDSVAEAERSVKQSLEQVLAAESVEPSSRLWIVMLGHGTFAANQAKFNLVGPDLAPEELSAWLEPLKQQIILVNCASASAPFLAEISGPNRIVITATKSGAEYNYARFGIHLASVLDDLQYDLDHDEEVSLLEAFLAGSNRTQRFYADQSRLATEHALLSDNTDKAGVTADFYRGVVPVKSGKEGSVDGAKAARVILFASPDVEPLSEESAARREELESELDKLRSNKVLMDESLYYDQLEELLLQLAELYPLG